MRDWDATTYERVSEPQVEWGRDVLERLELRGDETVLDAGCGTGRVTRLLIERLPRGRVVAVDASPSMLETARAVLRAQDRALLADLTELRLDEPVDAVFSSAVFHWILDHELLFARLHHALRPRGRLVAQCGGHGNLERFHAQAQAIASQEPFSEFLSDWQPPWNFATPEETTARLEACGFGEVECWLEPKNVRPPDPHHYLRAVCLSPYLEALPACLREPYLQRVLERVGDGWTTARLNITAKRSAANEVTLDYVRLNVAAHQA